MIRIYHPWQDWEDYRFGFYNNCSGKEKQKFIDLALEMFNSKDLTTENMYRVVTEWVNSCEHNLTNESMNKIAYIGQAACCMYGKVPSTVTMEAWNLLDTETQTQANQIAEEVLQKWIKNHNESRQTCLNLD